MDGKQRARADDASAAISESQADRYPLIGMNGAQVVIATVATLFLLYVGKLPIVILLTSALIAFVLEPVVALLDRFLPRVLSTLLVLGLVMGGLYVVSYYSFLKAKDFAGELPKYTSQIKQEVVRFRQQADKIAESSKQIMPEGQEDPNTVMVKQVKPLFGESAGSLTETLLAIGFVPFLVYFMLTWQEHMRSSLVRMFAVENRTTAYVTVSRITMMLRSFIAGNFVIGLVIGGFSAALFWFLHIPYWYFLGPISGFLSLVPYLGVVLAALPPLAAGMGTLKTSGILIVIGGVVVAHLVALNVLYPKILGKRLQLNPLVVTAALLIWGFIWGAMGLILAIPVTAALKIVCEHVEPLRGFSHMLGEGEESSG